MINVSSRSGTVSEVGGRGKHKAGILQYLGFSNVPSEGWMEELEECATLAKSCPDDQRMLWRLCVKNFRVRSGGATNSPQLNTGKFKAVALIVINSKEFNPLYKKNMVKISLSIMIEHFKKFYNLRIQKSRFFTPIKRDLFLTNQHNPFQFLSSNCTSTVITAPL